MQSPVDSGMLIGNSFWRCVVNLFTPAETVENYAAAGVAKTQAPAWRLLLLGILAGFLIAMGGAVTNTAGHSIANVGLCRLVSGLLFPFGLAMVIDPRLQSGRQRMHCPIRNHLEILLFFQNTLYPPFSRCMRVFNIGSVIIQFLYYIGFKVKILWKMPCDGILKYLRCIQICELFHLTYKIIVIHVKIFLFQCLRTNSLK